MVFSAGDGGKSGNRGARAGDVRGCVKNVDDD
jgi:hypothetical protein